MTLEDVGTLLKTTGLPVTYLEWPEGNAPQLPFICYFTPGVNNLFADGRVFYTAVHIKIELYSRFKSPDIEKKVETALADITWTKDENYIDSEKCYQILYEIEV